jgi:hypothetical protein
MPDDDAEREPVDAREGFVDTGSDGPQGHAAATST